MHEWALAEAVASFVSDMADKPRRIRVLLGELQNVDEEIFLSALKEMMGNLEIDLTREECVLRCNACKKDMKLRDLGEEERELVHFLPEAVHAYVSCPLCGSRDFTIVKGRGVEIESVEGS